jgi:hypothetical protein
MALAPGQHAWMVAAAGLLRSDASRSDWHPTGTQVPLYALSDVARSAATRSNYTSGRPFISLDGVILPPQVHARDPGILIESLTVTDLINAEPNRATFVAWGFVPTEGQRVVITLGSVNNASRLFSGRVLNTEQFYDGLPANLFVSTNCIDDTWGLNTRKVSERYTATTYEAIVLDLLAKYAAPTYRAVVAPDLGTIDEITFTNEDLTVALTQLAKRGGYDWLCDEQSVVRFFEVETSGTPPTILNAAHPSLDAFRVQRDMSQQVTRAYVEGGGVNAFAAVTVGETTLPVEDAVWYPPSGVVVCGPQRIRYSGKYLGGGGGLVGTGAAPSGAPSLALAPGDGLSAGPRDYAVTFVTGAGESVAGPRASITSGPTPPPSTAPTVSAPTAASGPGAGPDPGAHQYAVTFVTASGETTPGPRVSVTTGETAGPSGYPLPSPPTVGVGVDDGAHEYAVSFTTAIGETLVGPISYQVIAGPQAPPASAPTMGAATVGNGPEEGTHAYAVTFTNSAGETTRGPQVNYAPPLLPGPTTGPAVQSAVSGTGPEAGQHGYGVSFVTPDGGETNPREGPLTILSTGVVQPPVAPTGGAVQRGGNPQEYPGPRRYAVTFVTAKGETTPGASVEVNPPALGAPPGGMTATPYNYPSKLGELVPGAAYWWALTFMDPTTGNETPGSPGTGPFYPTISGLADLHSVPGAYAYYLCLYRTTANGSTFYRELGPTFWMNVTQAGQMSDAELVTKPQANPHGVVPSAATFQLSIPLGPPEVTARKIYRTEAYQTAPYKLATGGEGGGTVADNTTLTFVDYGGVASDAALAPTVNTASLNRLTIQNIPIGPPGVSARKLYRTPVGNLSVLALKLLATLSGNTSTTYTDSTVDANLGEQPPSDLPTAYMRTAHLENIPLGPAGTQHRKIYRTPKNSSALKLLATLSNNTAVVYTDSTVDANLGAAVPTVNTAAVNVIKLTEIPKGESGSLVESRKLYRRSGGAGLRYLATVDGNAATTYTDTTPNASLGAAPPSVSTAVLIRFVLSAIAKGGALVTGRRLYRTISGGAGLRLLAELADNTTTTYIDATPDAGLGAVPPAVVTASANQVALTAIPIGAAAVIARKLYRTAAYGSQLQLLATLADNVTATYLDAAADAALGAPVNTTDTSGLTQPQGNVIAGSVSLQIANIGPFPSEGWAVIGNGQQVIRYRSVSGNVLGGIPASGPGSISATIAYNSTVTASPQLVGIPATGDGAIRYPILKGDPVNLWVQADNLAARAKLAALMGTDGIIEGYLQDRRLSVTEALARAEAQLALRSELEVAISYHCRDVNTRAGRVVRVNLPTQHVVMVDFQLRQVVITQFGIPNLLPTFTASASTDRFSFEALIRAARKVGS